MVLKDKEQLRKIVTELSTILNDEVILRSDEVDSFFELLGERFCTDPASSNINYHSCHDGGLMSHTLNVIKAMYKLNGTGLYNCDRESIAVVGLFHDLGKIGSYQPDQAMYIDLLADDQWKYKRGYRYSSNPDLNDGLTHSLRSLRTLSKINFPLLDDEYNAIFQHDSYFEEQNRSLAMMRCNFPLVKLLQHADQMATINEKFIESNI